MPSKKVFLKRGKPFIHEGMNNPQTAELLAFTKRGLGSYFKSKTSKLSGHGLTDQEVAVLLPSIISIPADNNEFLKNVELYYRNINTIVPYGTVGRELEIGLKEDNSIPISAKNFPIAVEDYIRYRHAIGSPALGITGHPFCARSPEEAEGNSLVQYYVEDPEKVQNKELEELRIIDMAETAYHQVKDNTEKINMVVSLMAVDVRVSIGKPMFDAIKATNNDKLLALKQLSSHNPSERGSLNKIIRFTQNCNDPNITRKYNINKMLSKGILVRVGESILDKETSQTLGKTIAEVVNKVFDPQNVDLKNRLKILLDEKEEKENVLVEA